MKMRIQLPNKGLAVIKDLFLSVLAYALPAVVLSFFIQPAMARSVSDEVYGRFLTLLGIVRMLVGVFITSLANLRMLREKDYQREQVKGDFNLQLLLSLAISSVILVGVLYLYQARDLWEYLLCIITMLLIMVHDYYSVYYRVVLQYKKLVWDNVCVVAGYFVGLLIYRWFPIWQIVMISGYVLGNVYVMLTSPYIKEPFGTTGLCRGTRKKHVQMGASMLLRDSINYCDRLLIYPVMGGDQVAIYGAATVVGKVIQLVSTPAQRVILSYIVRQNTLERKNLQKLLLLGIPLLVVAYMGLYLVGWILLPILYPQYADAASQILWIILLAILLNTFAAMFNTILLRFDAMSMQIVIPAVRLTCYLAAALALTGSFGLQGFCYGYFASAVVFVGFTVVRLLCITGKRKALSQPQE